VKVNFVGAGKHRAFHQLGERMTSQILHEAEVLPSIN